MPLRRPDVTTVELIGGRERRELLLRDRLRRNAADRDLYERTKREFLAREWGDMNDYADAKTDVIEVIKGRAREARPARRCSGA